MLKPIISQEGGAFFCRCAWMRIIGTGWSVEQACANWIYRNLPWRARRRAH